MNEQNSLKNGALSRRTFLAGAGTAAAATLVAGCSNGTTPVTITPPTPPAQPTYTAVDILNFALNLEYLEAEFYLRAATGSGIPAADTGNSSATVTGGAKITGLSASQQEYVNQIAQDEYNHVKFLRAALGSAAVARPAIDLTNSFNGLATIATASTSKLTSFNPFASFNNFLIGGFVFEDVGVTAYKGGAGALQSLSSAYLGPAAQILAVEAYHAATLRTLIVGTSLPSGSPLVAGDQTYITLAQQIAAVRASLSGGATQAAGGEVALMSGVTYNAATSTTPASATAGSSTIVNADSTNAIAFSRTFDQVLHIVYASATSSSGFAYGVASGGFFPSGLNGNIKQTYS